MSKLDRRPTARIVAEDPVETSVQSTSHDRSEGPAAAAMLATGVGAVALGLATTLAEISTGLSDWLNFYNPVGPLSGKTTVAVAVWLLSWAILHVALRRHATVTRAVVLTTVVLLAFGALGTFPTFFQLFAAD